MDARQERFERRLEKAAQRMELTEPERERLEEKRRLKDEKRRLNAKNQRTNIAKPAPPQSDPIPLLRERPKNRDTRGFILGAMLLASPFVYWISGNENPVEDSPPVPISTQMDAEQHRRNMEGTGRELVRLRAANRQAEQDRLDADEARRLSDELRSQGIGISPAQARALLQTERDLMNE